MDGVYASLGHMELYLMLRGIGRGRSADLEGGRRCSRLPVSASLASPPE